MPEPRGLRPVVAAALSIVLVACASLEPAVIASAPLPPAPLDDEAIATHAALLQLEDLREFQAVVMEAAAASEVPSIRALAALAAGRIGAMEGRALVRRLLSDRDSSVAAAAAFAAGQLADSVAVPALAVLLDTAVARARPTVAAEAAAALGQIATGRSRAALAAFLENADTADIRLRHAVGEALIGAWRAGEASLSVLSRWVIVSDPEVRWRAAYAMTRTAYPEAVPLLLPRLDDTEPLVRAFALRGLGYPLVAASGVSRDAAFARIVEALDDEAYSVRIEAIRCLGTYPDAAAVNALLLVVENGESHERIAAMQSLGRLGQAAASAVPALRALTENAGTPVFFREVGIESLVAIEVEGGRETLRRVVRDPEWRVRAAVARLLEAYGTDALLELRPLVRDADPRVAVAALDAAVAAVDSASVQLLRPLLLESLQAADIQVRAAALRGLSRLADPSTYPVLLDAYDVARDESPNDAALAAIDAIADLGRVGTMAPERAFFTRFRRPDDAQLHHRALARFGIVATAAWGDPGAADVRATPAGYLAMIEEWVAPVPAERSLPRIRIETDEGDIDILLMADDAPLTATNFLELTGSGYFDGQEWPRVVPNFVVQGGDPRGDMSGGPGYTIRDELNRNRFVTGTVGMALSGADTGGSQFFITHSPQPHLDGSFTVFGRVIDGMEVIERLLPGQGIISVSEIIEPE